MFLLMLTFFFQLERAGTHSKIISGNDTLFFRETYKLSWTAAREACNSKSSHILPIIRDARALGLLHVGEFAWTDGKEYTFCYRNSKLKDAIETKETCRYVTVRRQDTRENLEYIRTKGNEYELIGEILPYDEAVQKCRRSNTSLQVVENFGLPMVVTVNRTYWIGEYNFSRIMNSLNPGENVTEMCIGIVKLDHDKFEFGTTSCDENHTVLCDASGFETALTLTTRNETMPKLGDIKARTVSNQRQLLSLIFIILGPTLGISLIAIIAIIAIVCYKKKKANQELAYLRKGRQGPGLLSQDNTVQQDIESQSKMLPSNSLRSGTVNTVKSNNNNSRLAPSVNLI